MYPNQTPMPMPMPMATHGRSGSAPLERPAPPLPAINAGWAAAAVIFFWPLAFAAFNYSSRVHPLWAAGDYSGAQHASEQAKRLGKISLVVWAILCVVAVVFYGAAIAMAVSASSTS